MAAVPFESFGFGLVVAARGWRTRAAAVGRSRAIKVCCSSSSSSSVTVGRSRSAMMSPAAALVSRRDVAIVSALALLLLCCRTCESSLLCYCDLPDFDGVIQEHERNQCFQNGHNQTCETNLTCVLQFHPIDDKYALFYGCGESYQHFSYVLCNHTNVPDGSGVLLCCDSSDYCNGKLEDLYPPKPVVPTSTYTYIQPVTSVLLATDDDSSSSEVTEAPWLIGVMVALLLLVIVTLVVPAMIFLAREIKLRRRQMIGLKENNMPVRAGGDSTRQFITAQMH